MKLPIMTNKKGETDIVHTLCHGYKGHGNFEQPEPSAMREATDSAHRPPQEKQWSIVGQIL